MKVDFRRGFKLFPVKSDLNKVLNSLSLSLSHGIYGGALHITGYTLVELQEHTSSSDESMSALFTFFGIGVFIATMLSPLLSLFYVRKPTSWLSISINRIMIISCVGAGVSLIFVPFIKYLYGLCFLQIILGFCYTLFFLVSHSSYGFMWKESRSWVHIFNSFHSVVDVIFPLFCGLVFRQKYSSSTNLYILYIITGIVQTLAGLFFILPSSPYDFERELSQSGKQENTESWTTKISDWVRDSKSRKLQIFFRFLFTINQSFLFCLSFVCTFGFPSYAIKYALKRKVSTEEVSSYVMSSFMVCVTLGRLLSVYMSRLQSPVLHFGIHAIVTVPASVAFVFMPSNIYSFCTVCCVFGICWAPLMTESFTIGEKNFKIKFSPLEHSIINIGMFIGLGFVSVIILLCGEDVLGVELFPKIFLFISVFLVVNFGLTCVIGLLHLKTVEEKE